jgi:hypothetical protein
MHNAGSAPPGIKPSSLPGHIGTTNGNISRFFFQTQKDGSLAFGSVDPVHNSLNMISFYGENLKYGNPREPPDTTVKYGLAKFGTMNGSTFVRDPLYRVAILYMDSHSTTPSVVSWDNGDDDYSQTITLAKLPGPVSVDSKEGPILNFKLDTSSYYPFAWCLPATSSMTENYPRAVDPSFDPRVLPPSTPPLLKGFVPLITNDNVNQSVGVAVTRDPSTTGVFTTNLQNQIFMRSTSGISVNNSSWMFVDTEGFKDVIFLDLSTLKGMNNTNYGNTFFDDVVWGTGYDPATKQRRARKSKL